MLQIKVVNVSMREHQMFAIAKLLIQQPFANHLPKFNGLMKFTNRADSN